MCVYVCVRARARRTSLNAFCYLSWSSFVISQCFVEQLLAHAPLDASGSRDEEEMLADELMRGSRPSIVIVVK